MRTRDAYFAAHPFKYETFDELVQYGLNYQFSEPLSLVDKLKARFNK